MGARLSESELQKSLDFCVRLFDPTTPEDHRRASSMRGLSADLLDVTSPIIDPAFLEKSLVAELSQGPEGDGPDTETTLETKMVLHKINARRIIHSEYAINNLELENLDGYVVHLVRGELGLVSTGTTAAN